MIKTSDSSESEVFARRDKLEFIEQLALLTITNYKLQITNGYITEGVFNRFRRKHHNFAFVICNYEFYLLLAKL